MRLLGRRSMLLVRTTLRPSGVHGLGLFADEFIPKGFVIWRFDGHVDSVTMRASSLHCWRKTKSNCAPFAI
jgi:hypothetical protein